MGIAFRDEPVGADLVEEVLLGELVVVLVAPLDSEPDDVVREHRVAVAVPPDRVGRPLRRALGGPDVGVHGAGVEVEVIRIAHRRFVPLRIAGVEATESAGHLQDVLDADRAAHVVRVLVPGVDRSELVERVDPLGDQQSHQGRGEALVHGPALKRGVLGDPVFFAIPLGNQPAPVEDHEGERHGAFLERRVHRRLELLRVHVLGKRLIREHVPHRPGVVLVHRGGDGDGLVERGVLPNRERDAALVAVEHRRPRDAGIGGDVDLLIVHVDLAPREPVAIPIAGGEASDLVLGGLEIEAGQEDRRAEHLGEAGRLVLDEHVRIQGAARWVVALGIEFVLGRTEDQTLIEVHVVRTGLLHERLLAAAAASGRECEEERGSEREGQASPNPFPRFRRLVIHDRLLRQRESVPRPLAFRRRPGSRLYGRGRFAGACGYSAGCAPADDP